MAGGFLSRARSLTSDDTIGLQCRSFHLHEQLAQEFDGARHYDFRQNQTFHVDLEGSPNQPKSASPTWISRSVRLTPLYSRDEFAGICVDKLRVWLPSYPSNLVLLRAGFGCYVRLTRADWVTLPGLHGRSEFVGSRSDEPRPTPGRAARADGSCDIVNRSCHPRSSYEPVTGSHQPSQKPRKRSSRLQVT